MPREFDPDARPWSKLLTPFARHLTTQANVVAVSVHSIAQTEDRQRTPFPDFRIGHLGIANTNAGPETARWGSQSNHF
jgi:hypothetical protein